MFHGATTIYHIQKFIKEIAPAIWPIWLMDKQADSLVETTFSLLSTGAKVTGAWSLPLASK
jgi:hypothetical protein